ncbi:MAG: 8-oxo-dGTP diphosphatase, partial [Erysipelotrichaceae bacterium]|nr:8-oxo-dGTP diphosphatase [Erysipelotrichaceae bacterium]
GEEFSGTLKDCDEGMLAWIPEEELSSLSLWEGDRIFLKKLMEQNSGIFSLELHYDRYGTLLGWKEREAEQE